MRNITLLLVLLSGLLAGYLIGDYRGKEARTALEKAIATGKTLEQERQTAITQLKTELDGINEKHNQELQKIRKDNAYKTAEWQRTKQGLDDKIKLSTAKLSESETRLKSLTPQSNSASGAERAKLEQEIAHLRQEQNVLRNEIEGNSCLQAHVPQSVFTALNETNVGVKK
jgi:Skp family chaperone for outer membrane proteins